MSDFCAFCGHAAHAPGSCYEARDNGKRCKCKCKPGFWRSVFDALGNALGESMDNR